MAKGPEVEGSEPRLAIDDAPKSTPIPYHQYTASRGGLARLAIAPAGPAP
jgi:hypothetical protein